MTLLAHKTTSSSFTGLRMISQMIFFSRSKPGRASVSINCVSADVGEAISCAITRANQEG